MIINHNIAALNSNRFFKINSSKMDKSLEALSSGQKINKGADDPAGLAVSEKMRAQIRGLNQASRNVQDASSLVQTAEGFLKETNDVLHRIRELTVQASNGTYNEEDRAQISVELDEMVKEINRIHEDAKFNTIRLLDNSSLGVNSFKANIGDTVPGLARNPNFNDVTTGVGRNGLVVQSGANTDERMFIQIDEFNTYGIGITDKPTDQYPNANNGFLAWREKSFYNSTPLNVDQAMYLESEITAPVNPINIDLMPPVEGNRLDVTTTEKSTESITVIDVALNKVNRQRADLGAFQNRLEMAREGIDNAAENLQSAESRIRDTDMAQEFVEFTKNQILAQSSATMTAQANVRSQLIMRILG
jgi:flagellin